MRRTSLLLSLAAAAAAAAVNPDGSYSHRVAIALPAGPAGVHPSLSLVYNSSGGDSSLGVGWELEGLPQVRRVRAGRAITFGADDLFQSHEGLLLRSGASGPYRAQRDDFGRWYGEGQCGTGPCTFRLEDRNGWTWRFGTAPGSRVPGPGGTFAAWALTRVENPSGLAWEVDYLLRGNHPLPVSVRYTLGVGTAQRRVDLTYTARPATDRPTTAAVGVLQTHLRRLARIDVTTAGVPVRSYVLGYNAVETRRSLLESIHEVGNDGVSALPALRFTSSPEQPLPQASGTTYPGLADLSLTVGASTAGWDGPDKRAHFADFDGDGRVDVLVQGVIHGGIGGAVEDTTVWLSNRDAWVNITSGSQTQQRVWSPDNRVALPGDFTGDGVADVMLLGVSDRQDSFLMVGRGDGTFARQNLATNSLPSAEWSLRYTVMSGFVMTPYNRYPTLGDFDGDGRLDLLLQANHASQFSRIRFGTGRVINLEGNVQIGSGELWAAQHHRLTTGDFNGDGVTDLLLQGLTDGTPHVLLTFDRTGTFTTAPLPFSGSLWATQRRGAYTLDVNGDGLPDLFLQSVVGGGSSRLLINTGQTFVADPTLFYGLDAPLEVHAGDFNADGRDDLVVFAANGAGTKHEAWASNGSTLELATPGTTGGPQPSRAVTADFDGDGRTDLLFLEGGSTRLWKGSGPRAHLVVETTNGTGARQALSYRSAARLAFDPEDRGPGRAERSPRMVVTSVTTHERARASYQTDYEFRNARLLVREAPLPHEGTFAPLGFEVMEERDAQTGQRVVTTFNQQPPFSGLVRSVEHFDAVNRLTLKEETLSFRNRACEEPQADCDDFGAAASGVIISRPSAVRTTTLEAGVPRFRRTRTMAEWDAFANPTLVRDEVEVAAGAGWRRLRLRHERNEYINQATPTRAIGLPWRARVCSDPGCNLVLQGIRTRYDGQPDGTAGSRLLATEVAQAAGAVWVATTRTFDGAGNVLTETGPDGLATRLEYDREYQRDRVLQEAPGEPERTFAVDPRYGLPLLEQDANGVSVRTVLDVHGRPVRKTWVDADHRTMREKVFQVHLGDAQSDGFTRVCEVGPPGEPQDQCTTTTVDSLGRTRSVTTHGALGPVSVSTVYDAAGRPWKTSEPYFGADPSPAWTVTAYDAAGRVNQVTHADGSITWTRYDRGTLEGTAVSSETVTSPGGVMSTKYKDIDGHVVRATEGELASGLSIVSVVDSTWDDRGRLVQLRSPGKTTDIVWDEYGRKLSITEPDTGITTYTYDTGAQGRAAWGKLLQLNRHDPNGGAGRAITTFTWDAQGRVASEASSDGTQVTFEYDDPAVAHSLGKLTRSTQTKGGTALVSEYAYDGQGNRSRVFRAITGPGFAFAGVEEQRFDVFGRLAALTYPDGSVATYRYHGVSRLLASVELDGAEVARWSNYSARGQAGQVQYGNGVTATWDYVPETGLLDRARLTNTTTSTPLLDADYRFDERGNVAEVVDRLDVTRTRRFAYDGWQRLTQVREGACLVGQTCRVLPYAYDFAGNLTQKEDTTFTLHPGTQRVASNGADAFAWSEGGNLLSKGSTSYSYDRRNMLAEVRAGGVLQQRNHHDQDGRRFLKERFTGASVARTFFVGRLYELTEFRLGARLTGAQTTRFVLGPDGGVVAAVTQDATAVRAPTFGSLDRFRRDTANGRSLAGLARAGLYGASVGLLEGPGLAHVQGLLLLGVGLFLFGALALTVARRGRRRLQAFVAVPTVIAMLASACGPRDLPPPVDAPEGFTAQLPQGTSFFHPDHLGSVSLVTDRTGTVTARLRYLPYGDLDPTSTESADATRRFTGQRFDTETGLYHFNARYFDPSMGRFTTADTLVPDSSSAMGFHRYAFSKGNPIRYSDPSGHSWYSSAWKAVGNYFSALGPKGCLLLGAAIVSVVLAPFTGGASLYAYIGLTTAMGVYEGIQAGSPEMVVSALATGLSQGFGLPVGLGWTPQSGWAVSLTLPITGGDAWGMKAAVTWSERGGVDAGVTLGVKNLSVSAGWSSKSGSYAGLGVSEGSISVNASWSAHGAASFGARYDSGALTVDAGFRSDRGFYLGASTSMKVKSGLGDMSFRTGLSATFDSSGASLAASASHAQYESNDPKGLGGLAMQQAADALKGERYELELL